MAKLELNVLIMGAGQVGQGLARRLTKEGHQVKIIDPNGTLLSEIENQLDALCIEGNGASASLLLQAGVKTTDLFIAVSDDDESNMIAGSLAKKFGVATAIARVRNEDYLVPDRSIYVEALNLDLIINPDEVASQELLDLLTIPVANHAAEFAEGRLKLIGFRVKPDAPIQGRRLKDLPTLGVGEPLLIACLIHENQVIIPRGDSLISAGDQVYVITSPNGFEFVNQLGGQTNGGLRKVVAVGASRVAFFLAERLAEHGVHMILIEQDEKRCERFADLLKDATILHGDGTDMGMLKEAGVRDADGFVACSQDDETNILSALLAKQQGATRVISVTRKPQYIPLMQYIQPIDVAINPRVATINAIMRYVRKGKTLSMTTLADDRAEAIEMEVGAGSPLAGRALKENFMPRNALLGAIVRGEQILIPKGHDALKPGDHAVLIALSDSVEKVDELFSSGGGKGWLNLFQTRNRV
ncbi:MAG: Trk system potassium transporter TrkA [bacterium]|nr:Trk system potassium transporter TrkA [bacterium]